MTQAVKAADAQAQAVDPTEQQALATALNVELDNFVTRGKAEIAAKLAAGVPLAASIADLDTTNEAIPSYEQVFNTVAALSDKLKSFYFYAVRRGNETLAALKRDKTIDAVPSLASWLAEHEIIWNTPSVLLPGITHVELMAIGSTSVSISWVTDVPADTQMDYGETTDYGAVTDINPNFTTAHLDSIKGLTPGTLYHYRIRARNEKGELGVSSDETFTTVKA